MNHNKHSTVSFAPSSARKRTGFAGASLLAIIAFGTSGCFNQEVKPNLPESWYRIGVEAAPDSALLDENGEAEKLQDAGRVVDAIYRANNRILENLSSQPSQPQDGAGKPADWVPWHLAGLITDISVSTTGVLGQLLIGGTASIQANWLPKAKPGQSSQKEAQPAEGAAALTVRATSSPFVMKHQLELVTQAALATGKVSNENMLRLNVFRAGERFQALAVMLSQAPVDRKRWSFDTYRLDLGIDAVGQLVAVNSIGAAVSFRLEWDRVRDGELVSQDSTSTSMISEKMMDSLTGFLSSVTQDLGEVTGTADQSLAGTGFGVSTVRIGLSVTAQGDFGIAKGAGSLMGSIILNRVPDAPAKPMTSLVAANFGNDNINMIDESPVYASGQNSMALAFLTSEDDSSAPGPENQIRYEVKRSQFRKGLKKAMKIGGFFARRAASARFPKWEVSTLYTEYDLSVTGTTGLTTVNGFGALEIDYARL